MSTQSPIPQMQFIPTNPKITHFLVDLVKHCFVQHFPFTLMITNFPLAAVNGGSKSSLASEDPFFIFVWQQYRRQTIFKQCEIPGGLLLVHPSELNIVSSNTSPQVNDYKFSISRGKWWQQVIACIGRSIFHRRVATVSTSDDLQTVRNPRWLTPGPSIRGIDTQRHIGAQEKQLRPCMSRITGLFESRSLRFSFTFSFLSETKGVDNGLFFDQ
ncbi:hypothetical protein CEXT_254531 [Caerostris extrusa]|uniref:Uncharacterized protein n=1 Tax=Caerostris extrusa TaxID=172846 RepID=A0AAV4SNN7_CAEEX|nr:hypothetical protein CEXT_254531 [Caerostris extrusa]